LRVNLALIQHLLVCFLLQFQFLDFLVCLLVLLQAFKLALDLFENLLEALFFDLCVSKCLLHLLKLLVKKPGACDFLEHVQEACLAALDHLLDLALLDDLELRLCLEAEAATFEEVEELLLSDSLAIEKVVLSVGLSVIALADSKSIRLNWNAPRCVIKGHLSEEGVDILLLVLLLAGCQAGTLMEHGTLLLLRQCLEGVAQDE